MGYYTYITGGGEIVPPIDDAKLKDFAVDSTGGGGEDSYFTFEQIAGDQTVQLVNGTPTVVGTDPGKTKVDFGYDESGKFYGFAEALGRLIDLCVQEGALFNAEFDGDGEESDDFWKYVVKDNVFEHIQGQVSFPDDTDKQAKVRSDIIERIKQTDFTQLHGKVIPRPDGTRDFTCVGLPRCANCRAEQEILTALIWKT